MPLSNEELVDLAKRLARYEVSPEEVDWSLFKTDDPETGSRQLRNLWALVQYEMKCIEEEDKSIETSQKRALGLLKSFMTRSQKREFSRRLRFTVVGSLGGKYRLCPNTGSLYLLEKHKSRWFGVTRLCYHFVDPENVLPPADISLAQMLILLSNEPEILQGANRTDCRSQTLWNGAWLRRLRAARREREEAREALTPLQETACVSL